MSWRLVFSWQTQDHVKKLVGSGFNPRGQTLPDMELPQQPVQFRGPPKPMTIIGITNQEMPTISDTNKLLCHGMSPINRIVESITIPTTSNPTKIDEAPQIPIENPVDSRLM